MSTSTKYILRGNIISDVPHLTPQQTYRGVRIIYRRLLSYRQLCGINATYLNYLEWVLGYIDDAECTAPAALFEERLARGVRRIWQQDPFALIELEGVE